MVTAIDEAVATVVSALETANLLNDTVIAFASDNGGQPKSGANNYPLRGGKDTLYEGGMRVPSMIYSRLFDSSITGQNNEW